MPFNETVGSVARILKNHFILRNPRDETYESLIPRNERLIPKNQLRHNGATARILKNGIVPRNPFLKDDS